MCEQIMRVGIIGIPCAVMKKADMEKISYNKAAYGLMDGIDTYGKLIDAKKQLNEVSMQIFMMNQFLRRQNYAVNALMRLQSIGVTNEEILNVHEFLNAARFQNAKTNPAN